MTSLKLAAISTHPIQYYAPIFRALARRCDLHVFYAQSASPEQQALSGFGVPFEWDVDLLEGYSSSFLHNRSKTPDPSSFRGCDTPDVDDRLKAGKYDAVLVFGWYTKSFIQAIWAAKRLGLPVLVRGDSQLGTPRSAMKTAGKKAVYPLFLRLFDAILYVGHHSREYYRHYRYPEERMFFSPHCVDHDWFAARATENARRSLRSRLGLNDDVRALLFAGKLVPFKRPLDVVSAVAKRRAQGDHVEVMVAGAGELERPLREHARNLEVPLHMLGFCNQQQMPEVYSASNALVLPSTGRETWGLVANEALACGKPIIVSDACGCAVDLAADRKAGRVFRMGDIHALSDAIESILDCPPSPRDLADKSEHYGVAAAVEGIMSALSSVCRGVRRKRRDSAS